MKRPCHQTTGLLTIVLAVLIFSYCKGKGIDGDRPSGFNQPEPIVEKHENVGDEAETGPSQSPKGAEEKSGCKGKVDNVCECMDGLAILLEIPTTQAKPS
jgi:hypothetical protein